MDVARAPTGLRQASGVESSHIDVPRGPFSGPVLHADSRGSDGDRDALGWLCRHVGDDRPQPPRANHVDSRGLSAGEGPPVSTRARFRIPRSP